jgi:mono/diheme cytochrome c family protein
VVARETPDVPQRPTLALLQAGQKLYAIHCSVCHGWTGYGDGIAVQRGFPRVESLHTAKGRGQSVAEIEDVIAHGRGKMFAMDNRLDAAKRRKIAFYVQALRLSRHFPTADLKPEQLRQVREAR